MQVKRALEQRLPGLEVVGTNYPVSPPKALAIKLVFGAQVAVIGLTLAGEKLFPVPPPWLKTLQESKLQSCLMAWFAGNLVSQNLQATGAFEVYYDGAVIFSKLQSGNAPDLAAVVRDVVAAHSRHTAQYASLA
jgi:selT/selW/selH-like putative selenoprotein